MANGSPPPPAKAAAANEASQQAQRLNADEIFEAVVDTGGDELRRPWAALAFSALAGGITIGLSALAVALVRDRLGAGPGASLLAAALYPLGFIAVVIGRAQFFTENTLYPVIAYLVDRQQGGRILPFWGVVLTANLAGAYGFALLAVKTSALDGATKAALVAAGLTASRHGAGAVFWSGVVGGWLMALVAWMVSASQWTSGQIMVTWLFTLLIGLGNFVHCVAGSVDALAAVASWQLPLIAYVGWLAPAVAGNVCGGVLIVSLLNYGQVKAGKA